MKISRSYTRQSTGEPFTVDIDIDLEELAQSLAIRALQSKAGKAIAMGGDIKCRIVKEAAKPEQS